MLFTPYDIRDCLYDSKRTKKFASAIKNTVKKGDVVVDGGSGSGILAFFAAKAGAKKVFAIELNKRYRNIIRQQAAFNNIERKIIAIHGDAKKIKLSEKVDLIICELIHTATFFEPQMQVIKNLKKSLKRNGRIIPEILFSYIELVEAQEKFYGLKMQYDSRSQLKGDKILSERKKYDEINFNEDDPVKLRSIVNLKILKNGTANAVRITGKLKISNQIFLDKSRHILMPEIIFFKKPTKVSRGQTYFLEIVLSGGSDPLNAKFKMHKKINSGMLKKCNYLSEELSI